jgi:hypothetical protein
LPIRSTTGFCHEDIWRAKSANAKHSWNTYNWHNFNIKCASVPYKALHYDLLKTLTWVTITVLVASFTCPICSIRESRKELCASVGSSWKDNWILVRIVWAAK